MVASAGHGAQQPDFTDLTAAALAGGGTHAGPLQPEGRGAGSPRGGGRGELTPAHQTHAWVLCSTHTPLRAGLIYLCKLIYFSTRDAA